MPSPLTRVGPRTAGLMSSVSCWTWGCLEVIRRTAGLQPWVHRDTADVCFLSCCANPPVASSRCELLGRLFEHQTVVSRAEQAGGQARQGPGAAPW